MILLRPPEKSELAYLSDLCLRSKAHWDYSEDFIEACRDELTICPSELDTDQFVVAVERFQTLGVAQIHVDENAQCFLDKLYVDPKNFGRGAGKMLLTWAIGTARLLGKDRMFVVADPNAVEFYTRFGAKPAGQTPSGSIPGRMLPRLAFDIEPQ